MPLSSTVLAKKINKALDIEDTNGDKIEVPSELKQYAEAIVAALKGATFSHSVNSVTGTAPSAPGPVPDLAAKEGKIKNLSKSIWKKVAGEGIEDPSFLDSEIKASISYLEDNALVEFAAGTLKGQSTASIGPNGPIPGALTGGGIGGSLTGLNGEDWAKEIVPDKADMDLAEKIFKTVVEYLESNIVFTYPPASVTGTFSGGSTPLQAGKGTGGIIS